VVLSYTCENFQQQDCILTCVYEKNSSLECFLPCIGKLLDLEVHSLAICMGTFLNTCGVWHGYKEYGWVDGWIDQPLDYSTQNPLPTLSKKFQETKK